MNILGHQQKKINLLLKAFSLLVLGSCNTITSKKIDLPNGPAVRVPPATVLKEKIRNFKLRTQKRGPQLNASDWKLHDELLSYYRELSTRKLSRGSITVPRNSQIKVNVESFCLDSSKASPKTKEPYRWKKGSPSIPYYQQILSESLRQKIPREKVQALLWNLQQGSYWENYSPETQSFLLSVDPKAPIVLPSKIRAQAQESAKNFLFDQVPGLRQATNNLSDLKGKYLNYEHTVQELASRVSSYPYIPEMNVSDIPGSALQAEVTSDGYREQEIKLTNPTNQDVEINLTDYYLEPVRKDVQPIGFGGFASSEEQLSEVYVDLEHALYDDLLRLGIGFTPGVNDVADAYEFLLGQDFITNQKLSLGGRLLSGIGLLAGSGAAYRYAERAAAAPERMVIKFEEEFARRSNKSIQNSLRNGDARFAVEEFQQVKRQVQNVPVLKEKLASSGFKKTDFYVRPNGDVIPSKGYRYVSSDASYADDLLKSGKIPANKDPRGTYVAFDKFSDSRRASDKLQIPSTSDARYRVEFDTKQVLDDIKIPWGKHGTTPKLEIFAEDFGIYGSGGARQAITQQAIQSHRIVDLKNGKIIYEKSGF